MARVFTANVVLNGGPDGITQFKIGDEVPEWASDRVGAGVSRDSDARTVDATGITVDEGADGSGEGENLSLAAADADADGDDEPGDYDEYSVEELKGEAKEREIKGYSKMNRDQLVAALEADDAETEEA